jgi:hypothetical protein
MGFDVAALVTTVRMHDGVMEMLHDVTCIDQRIGTVWMAADLS